MVKRLDIVKDVAGVPRVVRRVVTYKRWWTEIYPKNKPAISRNKEMDNHLLVMFFGTSVPYNAWWLNGREVVHQW